MSNSAPGPPAAACTPRICHRTLAYWDLIAWDTWPEPEVFYPHF